MGDIMANPISSPSQLVTDSVVTLVKPLERTAHVESIDPTFLDLRFVDLYVPVLFAYRLAESSDIVYLRVLNRIKHGLQKVLVPFFSFSGRWIASESNERLLLCNDEGVPFIQASVDKDLDDVVHTNLEFEAVPDLQGYGVLGMDFKRARQQMLLEGLPPAFVQVTRFKCGGLVLAVNFNHMHTDLKGFFNFMTTWSDLSRDNEIAVEVDHNREQICSPSTDPLRDFLNNWAVRPSHVDVDPDVDRPWVMKSWEVSTSAINSLKHEAKDIKIGPGFVSTQDCIAAHVWSSLARLPSSMFRGKEPRITLVVEGRRKFEPPVPDSYLGNRITPFLPTRIPTKELVEMPLASTACRIREKLATTTREEWLSVKRYKQMFDEFRSGRVAQMSITSWLKSPLYEMDFGFGKPFFARGVSTSWQYSRPPHYIGTASIGPPLPSGSPSSGATLSVFALPEVLQALQNDPLFLSFFVTEEKLTRIGKP